MEEAKVLPKIICEADFLVIWALEKEYGIMKKVAYKFGIAMIMMVAVALAALTILANTIMHISDRSQTFMDHEVKEIDTIHVINENYLQIYNIKDSLYIFACNQFLILFHLLPRG